MAVNLLAVHETAEKLLACVCATLAETATLVDGQPGCPCVACVVASTPAWDSCDGGCEGGDTPGQLTVHFAGMVGTTNFPQETRDVIGSRNCHPVRAAPEYVITLLRCAPSFSKEGCPPSCEEQTAAARILAVDAASIWNALLCCFPATSQARRGQQYVLGAQRTIGPEGGCVGVEQRVTIALPTCQCPEGNES